MHEHIFLAVYLIHMVPLSLGRPLNCRRCKLIISSDAFRNYSITFSKSSIFQQSNPHHIYIRGKNMSSSSSTYFNKILGTSISAANHAGKMVRDVMKGGDLGIIEKTGADDLQVQAL